MKVRDHLYFFERSLESLLNEEALKEPIKEIYFLLHQAYIELDKAKTQPLPFLADIRNSENVLFEDYLQSIIS